MFFVITKQSGTVYTRYLLFIYYNFLFMFIKISLIVMILFDKTFIK